ncbi:transcription initiation factor IIB [[Eubacterium] cellulosolvens]
MDAENIKGNDEILTKCPECGSAHLVEDYDHGEVVCEMCGLVLEDNKIDPTADWNAFDHEDKSKKERTGAPMTLTRHDKGLSTEISWNDRDSNGRVLSRHNRTKFYRLRKLHRLSKTSTTREYNISRALMDIKKRAYKMGLPKDVVETAAYVYRKAHNNNVTRGRSIACISAASIYIACRQCNLPRTLDEVSKAFELKRRDVSRTYNCMVRLLKINIPPTSPSYYIPRFCAQLGLNGETQKKVKELLIEASENGLICGRSPVAMVGALIYIASLLTHQKRTQAEIANVANVTEVTIRNRYKELKEVLGIEKYNPPQDMNNVELCVGEVN